MTWPSLHHLGSQPPKLQQPQKTQLPYSSCSLRGVFSGQGDPWGGGTLTFSTLAPDLPPLSRWSHKPACPLHSQGPTFLPHPASTPPIPLLGAQTETHTQIHEVSTLCV